MSQGMFIITVGFGIATITHCLYLAVALFTLNDKQANKILALLLIALSVRIGKSMVALALPESATLFSAIGLAVMTAIGPLIYIYYRSLVTDKLKVSLSDSIHLAPALLLLIGFTLLGVDGNKLSYGYWGVNIQMIIYILSCGVLLHRNSEYRADDVTWRWMLYLLGGVTMLWAAFMIQLIFNNQQYYFSAALVNVVVIYALTLLSKKHTKVLVLMPKKKNLSLPYYDLAKKIEELIATEALRDSSLTISKLATLLKVPPYVISHTVNTQFEKSFPELLLSYRLSKSEELLCDPANSYLTIEAIAYESGFSTLSAFYSGFKKKHKMTPALFRSRQLSKDGAQSIRKLP